MSAAGSSLPRRTRLQRGAPHWIPCVGPMLSGVLATVAAKGTLLAGASLLLVYSMGFALPMLAVGNGSQALRQRIRVVSSHPLVVRWASGLLLLAFGGVT